MATNEKLDRVIEEVQRRWGSKALRRLTTDDLHSPIPRLESHFLRSPTGQHRRQCGHGVGGG
jgi:hypothetical protein